MSIALKPESTALSARILQPQSTVTDVSQVYGRLFFGTTDGPYILIIDDSEFVQLRLKSDPAALALVKQGFEDVKAGRVTPYDPFADDPDDA